MKRLVFLLGLVLLLSSVVTAQSGVVVRTGYNLSLRARPDNASARLGTVPFDTPVTATAISLDRNWVAVFYNGQGGWLSLLYASVESGRLGDLPTSDQTFTPGGTAQGVTSPVNVRTLINLRYRTEPTLDIRPVGAIPFQSELPALALSSDGQFVLVNYLGQNVWVFREYVAEVSGSLSSFTPGAPPITASAPEPQSAPAQGQEQLPPEESTSNPAQQVCTGDIYNCGSFSSCGEVMAYWNACPGDPSRLDSDGDGRPCETLCGG